jgi:hypothetical protein
VNGLADFLRARLDEDEAVAQATGAKSERELSLGRWTQVDMTVRSEAGHLVVKHSWPQEIAHIVRHDPARVLADVAAKRAIVDEHALLDPPPEPDDDWPLVCRRCEDRRRHDAMRWPCPTLRHLAAVYADHPDYDQEWAP